MCWVAFWVHAKYIPWLGFDNGVSVVVHPAQMPGPGQGHTWDSLSLCWVPRLSLFLLLDSSLLVIAVENGSLILWSFLLIQPA